MFSQRLKGVKNFEKSLEFREILIDQSERSDGLHLNKALKSVYTILSFIAKALFPKFKKPRYFWFLLLVVIDFSGDFSQWSLKLSTLLPLVVLILVYFSRVAIKAYKKRKAEKIINSVRYQVWKKKSFIEKSVKEIAVGDLIYLTPNQTFPADTLLIAADTTKNCVYIDIGQINGTSDLILKKTIRDSQNFFNGETNDIGEILSKIESIRVTPPNACFDSFAGKIKFRGNPRASSVDIQNFVAGNSVLIDCSWVLGIVVYARMESKVWLNKEQIAFNRLSRFEKAVNADMAFSFIIMAILSLITCFVGFYQTDLHGRGPLKKIIAAVIILYSGLVPISLSFALVVFRVIQKYLVHMRNKMIKINNYNAFDDISHVEYVLTEKNKILVDEKLQICIIYQELYRENDSANSFENPNPNFCELKDEIMENLTQEKHYFLLSLLLCNKNILNSQIVCESADDNKLILLANYLGGSLVYQNKKICDLNINGMISEYEIICCLYPNKESTWILLQRTTSKEGILLAKSVSDSIFSFFSDEDYNVLKEILYDPSLNGARKIIFGYKHLKEKEVKRFKFDLKKARNSSTNKETLIQMVIDQSVKDLTYLGIIGFEAVINPDTVKCLESLKEAGIKIWITTVDSEESTIFTGIKTGLFTKKIPIHKLANLKSTSESLIVMENLVKSSISFEGSSDSKINNSNTAKNFIPLVRSEYKVIPSASFVDSLSFKSAHHRKIERSNSLTTFTNKKHLTNMSLGYFQKSQDWLSMNEPEGLGYVLSVDSISFDFALGSKESRIQLSILLFFAKSVIFYKISPDQQSKLIKLLHRNFSFRPIVAVLNSAETIPISLLETDILITVSKSLLSNCEYSDVNIMDFSDLPRLLIIEGYSISHSLNLILTLAIFNSFGLTTLLFLYQFLVSFSGTPLMSYDILVIYMLLISFFPILLIGIFDKNYKKDMQNLNCSQTCWNWAALRKQTFYVPFQGVLVGCIIFVFVIYGIGEIVNSQGFTEDFETKGVVALILLDFALLTKIFVISSQKLQSILIIIASILLLLIVLFTITSNNLGYYLISTSTFTDQSSVWIIICLFPLVCVVVLSPYYKQLKRPIDEPDKTRPEICQSNYSGIFTDSKEWNKKSTKISFEMNKFSLNFLSEAEEKLYRNHLLHCLRINFRILMAALCLTLTVNAVLSCLSFNTILEYRYFSVVPMIIQFILTATMFWSKIDWEKLNMILFVFLSVLALTDFFSNFSPVEVRFPILFLIFGIFTKISWVTSMVQISILTVIFVIFSGVKISKIITLELGISELNWAISIIGILALIIIASYFRELSKLTEFIAVQKKDIEITKVETTLSYLLPEFVRKRVKEGVRYIAEDKGIVSVVFCDICDFDEIVNIYSPSELTGLIHQIFQKIDDICDKLAVTKIETVGKTYLACAGLQDCEIGMDENLLKASHARRAVELGLEILKKAEKIKLKNGKHLKFKIGINSGPVTAGVVGYHKPQFSLVGDTVNTASRMSSTLTNENCIQISLSTYELIDNMDGLLFEDTFPEVKGKGIMNTKLVRGNFGNFHDFSNKSNFISFNKNSAESELFYSGTKTNLIKKNENFESKKKSILKNLYLATEDELQDRKSTQKPIGIGIFIFDNIEKERQFRKFVLKSDSKIIRLGLIVAAIYNAIFIILELIEIIYEINSASYFRISVLAIEEICTIFLLSTKKQNRITISYPLAICSMHTISILLFFASFFMSQRTFTVEVTNFYYKFLQINLFSGMVFVKSIYFSILASAIWVALVFSQWLEFSNIAYLLFFIFIVFVISCNCEYHKRTNYIFQKSADKELEKIKELLSQMMPPHALKNFQEENIVSEKLSQVTLLYADIVGFTAWSSIRTSQEVVEMLSELFTRFDKMCVKHRIYKVHTIGDCYVAMGFVNDNFRNPAKEAVNLLKFAESLLGVIQETNEKCGCQLSMRIGIHTGIVIGGITGTNVVRYDIYGPDVMIANKMESNGEQGKIALSENTKILLEEFMPERFSFEPLKEISIPTLGKTVQMFSANLLDQL